MFYGANELDSMFCLDDSFTILAMSTSDSLCQYSVIIRHPVVLLLTLLLKKAASG